MKLLKVIFVVSVIVSLIVYINGTDLGKAVESIQLIGWRFVFVLLITFLAYFLATIGWRYCMGGVGRKLSLPYLFVIRHVGETVALVNPVGVIGGETVKVMLLNRKGINNKVVILSVLLSRIVMIGTQLLLFLGAFIAIAAGYVDLNLAFPRLSTIAILLFSTTLTLWVISKSRKPLVRFLQKITFSPARQRKVFKWRRKLRSSFSDLSGFYRSNKSALAWSAVFTLAHWVAGSLEFYLILKFLGLKITVVQALLLDIGVAVFKAAGNFVPAQIGIEEYGNKVMLSLIGITGAEVWITVSFVKRIRQICWIVLGLAMYLLIYKRHRHVLNPT